MSTQFTTLLPPPGALTSTYNRLTPPSSQPSSIPPTFLEAMSIRETVFVHTQSVPLENEFDADDPRSWHWVVYASVGAPKSSSAGEKKADEQRRGSGSGRVPVGTMRLVPPPHPPHPEDGSSHLIDNIEDAHRTGTRTDDGGGGGGGGTAGSAREKSSRNRNRHTSLHDGGEPYVKLGRLATLPEYRGLGLGRLLVNTALEWVQRNAEAVSQGSGDPVEREREGGEDRWRGLVMVHAQVGVQGFWKGLGFVTDEGLGGWWEEGIRHVGMWRRLEVREGRGV